MAVEILSELVNHAPNPVTLLTLAACAIAFLALKRWKYVQRVNRVPGMTPGMTILGDVLNILVEPAGNELNLNDD